MMTRQEVKDERRNSEGDALLKGAQRRLARRLMQKQMLAAVATADVVLTTHPLRRGAALRARQGPGAGGARQGRKPFAHRIKALAIEHGVPMVENKPLARMLYSLGRVGETIPTSFTRPSRRSSPSCTGRTATISTA